MLIEMLQDCQRVPELPWSRRYHIVLKEAGESLRKSADRSGILALMMALIPKIALGRLKNGQTRWRCWIPKHRCLKY